MDMLFVDEVSSEVKKDILRSYLKDFGILDKLLEAFEKLQNANVKPENPLEFVRKELGGKTISPQEIEHLEQELDDAHLELRRLRRIMRKHGIKYTDSNFPGEFNGAGKLEHPK